jgi:DNA-binding MarR family transcriptional regulator
MSTPLTKPEFLKKWRHALAPYNMGHKLQLGSQLMYRDFLERLEPYGLTPFHYLVLCCLWEEDGLSTSGIAEKLGQLGATLTGVVDRMEDRKLVYRERDPQDRRTVRVWLAPEGEKLKEVLPQLGEQTVNRALKGISKAEQELVVKVLNRITANLSSRDNSPIL